MRNSYFFATLILFYIFPFINAQESNYRYLVIDLGFESYFTDYNAAPEYVRQDISRYAYDGYTYNSYQSSYSKWHTSIKTEKLLFSNRIGLISGIRYQQVYSEFGTGYSSSGYYYFLTHSEGQISEYLKVSKIREKSSCLGIPVELRYFFYKTGFVRVFTKAAIDVSYRFSTKYQVDFYDSEMNPYYQEVLDLLGDLDNIFTSIYFTGGIKMGNDEGISMNIEIIYPAFILSPSTSLIANPEYGGGVQVSVQYPF
jgi:hypothetical protein